MKLKIVSDGTSRGSRVLTEDGKEIEGVESATWTCHAPGVATATLTLRKVPVELEGYLEAVKQSAPLPPPRPPGSRKTTEAV